MYQQCQCNHHYPDVDDQQDSTQSRTPALECQNTLSELRMRLTHVAIGHIQGCDGARRLHEHLGAAGKEATQRPQEHQHTPS